jgi:hypothetical protein
MNPARRTFSMLSLTLLSMHLAALPSAAQAPPGDFTAAESLVVRRILDLNGRQDVSVDSVVELNASRKFDGLRLHSLGISVFPPEIGRLRFVQLKAGGNKLTVLPPEMNDIYPLRIINLENNLLERLPGPLDRVSEVWMIGLSHNRLTAITAEDLRRLGQDKIAVLNLDHNRLESVAPNLLDVAYGLQLDNNRLTTLPMEFLGKTPRGLFSVDSNRICDIPDTLAAWITRHARNKNWRSTQDCNAAHLRKRPSGAGKSIPGFFLGMAHDALGRFALFPARPVFGPHAGDAGNPHPGAVIFQLGP